MNLLLIGNAISLVGAVIMIATGLIKKKRNILIAQNVQFGFMAVGNFILGGISGTISNIVGIIRNTISFRREFTLPFKLAFVAIQAILTIIFNNAGLIGWLPFFATVIFTWCLDAPSEKALKFALIVGQLLWAVYDMYFQNYSGLACDIFTVLSNIIGLYMLGNNKDKEYKSAV